MSYELRKVLENARHALATSDGMYVTDSVEAATEKTHSELNNSVVLAELDSLLDPPGRLFDPITDVKKFLNKFGWSYDGKPRSLDTDLLALRMNLLREEVNEYTAHAVAINRLLSQPSLVAISPETVTRHLEEVLDALVDITYATIGTALLHGLPVPQAWDRVHAANMKKELATEENPSSRRSRFDVVKPEGWKRPDHHDLVSDHAHTNSDESL